MSMLLVFLLVVPLAGAIAVALLGGQRKATIRWISLATTLVSAALAIILAVQLAGEPHAKPALGTPTFEPHFVTRLPLLDLGPGTIDFYIGLDGLNIWLVALTSLLMISAVLVSWDSPQVRDRENEYYAWLLGLECALVGVFVAFDIILFYVFFELSLIPLFFLIGIWGGPERRYAARKFFIYTFSGSILTQLGLMAIVLFCFSQAGRLTFAIPELVRIVNNELLPREDAVANGYIVAQYWIFLAMAAGFSIKVPLVPFHTWLPLAHVEAPTAGSVLLAGVLLKLGTYGFLRMCLPLTPDASVQIGMPLIGSAAVIGIIYGALCSLAQSDIKKLVAYSSVSHLGLCMLGMFALNAEGLSGSLLQMINHGLSTGALFLLVGMLYDRYHSRQMEEFGGLGDRLRLLSCCMVFICLSSIGLPFLNGFVGEALIFLGSYRVQPYLAVPATAGVVLGAWYLLRLLRKVFFGPLKEPAGSEGRVIRDMNLREMICISPIVALCLWLGVYPEPVLRTSSGDIKILAKIIEARTRPGMPSSPSISRNNSAAVLSGERLQ